MASLLASWMTWVKVPGVTPFGAFCVPRRSCPETFFGHTECLMTDKQGPATDAASRPCGKDDLELTLNRAECLVARAQDVFETTVEVLEQAVRALKAMPDAGEGEVLKDVRAMNSALLFAMDLQEKARVAGSRHFGTEGRQSLDLAAARSEIRERLARLRDAGGGDGVS